MLAHEAGPHIYGCGLRHAGCLLQREPTALDGAEAALSPVAHFLGRLQWLALTVKKNLATKLGINTIESQNDALNLRGRRSKGWGRQTRLGISQYQKFSAHGCLLTAPWRWTVVNWMDWVDGSESSVSENKTVEQRTGTASL